MYSMLLDHAELGKYDCTSIRFCISGSAPLPPEVQKKFMEVTEGVLVEGYGLTESSPVTHCNPLDRSMKTVKVGSIGLPWPDTDAKIVDMDKGETELQHGETGEVAVKGPQVMKGYWNMPTETANVLRDGWLHTGDIARMDHDGFFQIVDRKKDMILGAGGFNIYPREVEEVLLRHPGVRATAVVGRPDPEWGESVVAFIEVAEDAAPLDAAALDRLCLDHIARYKRPKDYRFVDALPTNNYGKVVKRELREQLDREV